MKINLQKLFDRHYQELMDLSVSDEVLIEIAQNQTKITVSYLTGFDILTSKEYKKLLKEINKLS